jgi:hypothetical protein
MSKSLFLREGLFSFAKDSYKRPPLPAQGEAYFPVPVVRMRSILITSLIRSSICLDFLARILVS